ncbi:uncharacterized protein K02A2.6-like [Mizuhopecten yessoensis]|uniref:uncharacterized protein K02A2.6-like n=1 Tax=Mizuhopecten yessoensis TaxID=6573 RepID=UPI000B4590B0|nr:uncharacterized protein K02A2.6-like [Mizuhopecten yessoensis]
MTSTFGKIDAFDDSQGETWEHYTERLGQYFVANGIGNEEPGDKEKRRAILLSVCRAKVYTLMSDLSAPTKPSEKTYEDLVVLVKEHSAPKPSEIEQRYKFHNRFRKTGESVSQYIAALRNLSEHCNFGGTLETMIRDRLVCGINEDRIQRRLLSEGELTFTKSYEIAISMETAAKNVIDLQQDTTPAGAGKIHKVSQLKRGQQRPKSQQQTQGHRAQAPNNQGNLQKPCFRCGGKHKPQNCKFKDSECFYCRKKGHIIEKCLTRLAECKGGRVTHSSDRKKQNKVNALEEVDDDDIYPMFRVSSSNKEPYTVTLSVNGIPLQMEIDTGASKTVVGEPAFERLTKCDKVTLKPSNTKLKTYTGEMVPVLGRFEVPVNYGKFDGVLQAEVVKGDNPCLLGRDWLQHIQLDWNEIFSISHDSDNSIIDEIVSKHPSVFEPGLSKVRGTKAKIYVDPQEKPLYFKARPTPYALRDKIEHELDRLVAEGTISPVEFSEWATPIVPIVKSDKSIRICGDYKVTVNKVSKLDNYPIPKTEDLYATLGGGTDYSKLDLSQVYQQLELDDSLKPYTTINTHKGLFVYNRLPYGVASAPGIFQRTMENLLQGIPQVIVRVDDILVTGKNRRQHLENLEAVLNRLEKAGVKLKRSKCYFLRKEVEYLGHRINSEGMQPIEGKVMAIKDAPAPTNVKELQAFLGMLNYYSYYLPRLSTTLAPLYALLGKDVKWKWDKAEDEAFREAKDMLQSDTLLVHYDPDKELVLSCDASPYGLGAVLSHVMLDGRERPIAYVSRTLAPAEKNYSQLDKEGAALIFGVRKFHQYLFGQKFVVYTDHKPLLGLFKADRAIPSMASARIQRWALLLATYEYDLRYRPGTKNSNADGLSRLPLSETVVNIPLPGETLLLLEHLDTTPVTFKQIQEWTAKDPVLIQVLAHVQDGWNKCGSEETKPYFNRKAELSCHEDVLLHGNRVVVPKPGRAKLLEFLHEGHPGIVRMKALARSHVWWPGIDSDIQDKVQACTECQLQRPVPPVAPLHSWDWPDRPWSRIHVDYAGPFLGQMFLVVVDSYSKWLEVVPTNSSTSTVTIAKLRQIFAEHGLPDKLVSDNGPCFISEEFETFLRENGIQHVKISPHHPATNGLAERSVRIFKEGMKKMGTSGGDTAAKLSRFLLSYRSTPQTTTGLSPAELLFNRKLRTKLDLVKPDVRERVVKRQQTQKNYHDSRAKERVFAEGDQVFVKNFYSGPKWKSGEIVSKTSPVSYTVEGQNGVRARRHVDHIRQRHCLAVAEPNIHQEIFESDAHPVITAVSDVVTNSKDSSPSVGEKEGSSPKQTKQSSVVPVVRPQRVKTTPAYLKDYVTQK